MVAGRLPVLGLFALGTSPKYLGALGDLADRLRRCGHTSPLPFYLTLVAAPASSSMWAIWWEPVPKEG